MVHTKQQTRLTFSSSFSNRFVKSSLSIKSKNAHMLPMAMGTSIFWTGVRRHKYMQHYKNERAKWITMQRHKRLQQTLDKLQRHRQLVKLMI